MGNVMCCCKGREKSLEEGKMDESGIPAINKSKSKAKNKYKTPEGNTLEKSYAGESTRSAGGAPESAPQEVNNNIIIPESNPKLSMANFNTFGGDNLIGDEEFATNSNNKPKKPQNNATHNSNKNSLNSNKSTTNSINSESSKSIVSSTTLSSEPTNTKKISKIYLRISIENLDIFYRTCEDFGLLFKPFLEIQVENQELIKVYPIQGDGDVDKSLNGSVLSNMSDTSMNLSQNLKTGNSFLTGKEKSYGFKFAKSFEIPNSNLYSNIKFKIKNDVPKNNYPNVNNLPPLISIGEAKIPVNLLYKNFKESTFDGNLEIKLRNNSLVGYLKVMLSVSEKSLAGQDEFMDRMQKAKFLDGIDEENKILDNISSTSHKNSLNLWDNSYINFEEIDSYTLDRFFLIEIDKKEQIFNFSKTIPRKIPGENNNNYDHRDLMRYFAEASKTQNLVALYQILILFVKMTIKDDFKTIGEFFKLLTEFDKNNLIEFCKNCNDNPYIIKLYLIFFNNYMRYFKNNKSITIRNNKDIEDIVLIKNMIELIIRFTEKVKSMNNTSEVKEEIRDCILWCLNLLYELIATPSELNFKGNKDQIVEQKKKEFTVIYENCIQVVYKRIHILRILDIYITDSEIVGSIFRIFRKTVQVLTTDNPSLLDMTRLNMNPKDFSTQFRKLIIEQNDGIFFNTLKIMLSKYHHYPELHVNILIIIYQLTNYCDSQSLMSAAEKLNINVFKEVFDIYRGRLRNFNKILNSLHLNILSNFSEVAKNQNEDSYSNLMKMISNDIKSFYKISQTYKKRLDDFRIKKKIEFEIHEIITRIGVNITKYSNNCVVLMESFFFDDIIEFLIIIGVGEFNDNESVNSNKSNNNSADYILKMKEKKKKMNLEEIKKIVLSIVENSVAIIYNVMSLSNEISDPFSNKLAEHDIGSADDLFELVGECRNLLVKYGINVDMVDKHLNNIQNLFD